MVNVNETFSLKHTARSGASHKTAKSAEVFHKLCCNVFYLRLLQLRLSSYVLTVEQELIGYILSPRAIVLRIKFCDEFLTGVESETNFCQPWQVIDHVENLAM